MGAKKGETKNAQKPGPLHPVFARKITFLSLALFRSAFLRFILLSLIFLAILFPLFLSFS
jgi:hypothetical protein